MKKRLFAGALSLVMLLSLLPATAFATGESNTTLPTAVDGVITLNQDVVLTSSYAVESGNVTIDLKGHKLSSTSADAITVKSGGNLSIKDTSDKKEGSVIAGANGKAALVVMSGGSATLNGGTLSREGNGSWYVIKNHGTLTINGGTTVKMDGSASSLIANGWYDGSKTQNPHNNDREVHSDNTLATLTINGGTFSGGMNTVKNDDYSKVTIKNGTFTNTAGPTILNWNMATIEGGSFTVSDTASSVISNGYLNHDGDNGLLVINGGSFTSADNGNGSMLGYGVGSSTGGQVTIAGGTFNGVLPGGDKGEVNEDGYVTDSSKVPYTISVTGGKFSNSNVTPFLNADTHTTEAVGTSGTCIVLPASAGAVAETGSQQYKTLDAAVAAAADGGTVKLLADATAGSETGQYNFWLNKNITLDLNQKTLTAGYQIAVGVNNENAKVTIKNGTLKGSDLYCVYVPKGTVTLDNIVIDSDVQRAVQLDTGTLTIKNSTIHAATSTDSYGVLSFGNKNKVTIENSDISAYYWAIYHNGSYHGFEATVSNSTLTSSNAQAVYISGSTETTSENGNKNQQASFTNCTITGQTGIEGKYTDISLKDCTVTATADAPTFEQYNNGSTTAGFAVVSTDNSMEPNDPKPSATVKIDGGEYAGLVGLSQLINKQEHSSFEEATYEVSSGYFTSDPSDYLAENKAAIPSDKAGYSFMVGDKATTTTEVKPATGEPAVKTTGIEDNDVETVTAVAKSVEDNGVLAAAASTPSVLNDANNQATAAKNAYKAEFTNVDDNSINIYAQTYLNIEATAYDSTNQTVTLDITPMYRVVASTAEAADKIKLENSADDQNGKNAVVLKGSEKPLTGIKNIQLTVDLPSGFDKDEDTTYYVKHDHNGSIYYYPLTITAKDDVTTAATDSSTTSYTATFTNTKGFSLFTLPVTLTPAASITVNNQETVYKTLQAAVDDVQDGQTITLLGNNSENVEVSRTVNFMLDTNSNTFNGSITGGSRTTVNQSEPDENGITTYTCTRSSSGSGSGVTTYAITTNSPANGTVTVSSKSAAKDAAVTITVTPASGYQLDKLTVVDKDGKGVVLTDKGNGTYTFTMPASKVEVTATFKEVPATHVCPAEKFIDVDTTQWYHEGVDYVIENGMMNGTGTNTFEPNATTTRGMIVTILYRLEKEPSAGASPFTDVDADQWYAKAVAWAAANGVVNGTSPTTFNPNDPITREQMAAILYRYASFKGYDVTGKADLAGFTDAAQISDYAKDPMAWANKAGLIGGVSADTLQPQGSATRAQVATILMRFCENVAK